MFMLLNFEIVSLILPLGLSSLLFYLGMKYQNHRTKKSHIREKAKEIDKGELMALKRSITTVKSFFDTKIYITFDGGDFKGDLKINENYFIDSINLSGIFKIDNDEIVLSYQNDKILNGHMETILPCLREYQKNVSHLRKNLRDLSISEIPYDFENDLKKLIIDEFGVDKFATENRKEEFLLILYVIALTGSDNSYKSGRTFVVDLIDRRFPDLQKIVADNSKSVIRFNEIKTDIENINRNLMMVIKEIQSLHDDWQNELMV